MDLCDLWRKFETSDEDLKTVQIFGMRIFSNFGASMRLALHGYHQNAATVMRDVTEITALLELFKYDPDQIRAWRENQSSEKPNYMTYAPASVRKALKRFESLERSIDIADKRAARRAERYKMFSTYAAHVSLQSDAMMRPRPEMDAVIGPFIERTTLTAVIEEMGLCASHAGHSLAHFIPTNWPPGADARIMFYRLGEEWWEFQNHPSRRKSVSP